jgi:5-methyltetrahydrofolate--homocysteine methyltransferase
LTLVQQSQKTKGAPLLCLDFIAPKDSRKTDYMGAFCVTTGFGVDEIRQTLLRFRRLYPIMVKALADRFAEALPNGITYTKKSKKGNLGLCS